MHLGNMYSTYTFGLIQDDSNVEFFNLYWIIGESNNESRINYTNNYP